MSRWRDPRVVLATAALLGGGACTGKNNDGGDALAGDAGTSDAGSPCGTPDAGSTSDSWCPINLVDAPEGGGPLVWTGTEVVAMLAGRYDPVADTWRSMSASGAPMISYDSKLAWTGSEVVMLDFPGPGGDARYDPVADAWSPLSAVGAPPWGPRSVVWTGTQVLVFGCDPDASGNGFAVLRAGAYDPATDTWTSLSFAGAPGQIAGPDIYCGTLTAVWTGTEAIVVNCAGEDDLFTGTLGELGRYDPTTDTWTLDGSLGNWCSNPGYTSVWTGEEMILWGRSPQAYNPSTMTMRPVSTAGAPYAAFIGDDLFSCPAVWTGSLMLVWGTGCDPTTGGRYDPATDTWAPITSVRAPPPTSFIVWAGTQMVVWAGPESGGRYTP